MSKTITVGPVRLSYVHVLKPYRAKENQDEKYGVTLLIDKKDKKNLTKIKDAIEEAKREGTRSKFGGKLPPDSVLKIPIHDGDGYRPSSGDEFGPECKGMMVMNASTGVNHPPKVVAGRDRHEVTSESEIYSGCYGYVSLRFGAYNNQSVGIGCYLGNVLKDRDGEPLDGSTTVENDFGGIEVADSTEIDPITGEPITDDDNIPFY